MSERVVITGAGVVSPMAVGFEDWSAAVGAGSSARQENGAFRIAGFNPAPLLESRKGYLDPHSALFLGATALALRDAGLGAEGVSPRHALAGLTAGFMAGSAWGGIGTLDLFFKDVVAKGPRFGKPILFPHAYLNTAAAMAAIEWCLAGPHEVYAGGALASAHALLAAIDTLAAGEADLMVAGGCEAVSTAMLAAYREAAGDSQSIPGEGAAVFVLETEASARARDARVRAAVKRTALSGDASLPESDSPAVSAPVSLQGDIVGADFAFALALALTRLPAEARTVTSNGSAAVALD